jgi:hypothetical protein
MNTQLIVNGLKRCSKCDAWKPVSQYKIEKKKRPAARCIECERLRQREGVRRWDKEKRKEAKERFAEKKKAFTPRSSRITICTCEQCNKLWVRKGKVVKRFCSTECGKKSRYQQRIGKPLIMVPKDYNCKNCGNLFIGTKPGRCKPCKKKQEKEMQKPYKKAYNKKRSASIRTVAIHNIIDKKVFQRDKWRCCSCGIKVQKKDHLKDNAAEIDHIVPVSLGGPHSYSNVQTLCRRCNISKSNTFNGQLVLAI